MTVGSSIVKITAKTALKNHWLKCIVSCAILIFGCIICYNISYFLSYLIGDLGGYIFLGLLMFFLIFGLFLGLIRFIWRMLFGVDDSPLTVFYYFSDKKLYIRSLKLVFSLCLRALIYAVFLYIPYIIVAIFSDGKIYELLNIPIPIWTSSLYYFSLVLRYLATVALLFKMVKYYVAPILVVADENMVIEEALHMSTIISKKTYSDYIFLTASMLGWILLSFFIFTLVFTLPYILTVLSVHVRFSIADYNKHIKNVGNNSCSAFVVGV